jgi:hypothetical protein
MALCALPAGVVAALQAAGLLAPDAVAGRDPAGRPIVDATAEMAVWCRLRAPAQRDRNEAQALALAAELIDRAIGKSSAP